MELPVAKPSIEKGQAGKGLRDLVVGVLSVIGVALVSYGLENADVLSSSFSISADTIVTTLTLVAGLFGWRTIRK